jgi:polyphosphate kinase 2 (PPK2 family)
VSGGALGGVDLAATLPRREAEARLEAAQRRLLDLRLRLGGLTGDGSFGPPIVVVFEGWDASGKGGAIRRLVQPLDPRHVRVTSFAAPNSDELRHHWLWRFWPLLPGWGGMAVFDRSWYGRVLVERVEGFASTDAWQRAYAELREFEGTLTAEGAVIVKFWLHISDEEQLKRFEARANDPLKQWKLTDEDWRNRERRAEYTAAIEDMIAETGTDAAPWHVVAAESKRVARVSVVETVVERIEGAVGDLTVPETAL